MSSTNLSLDTRDIRFAFKEWLPIQKINESEIFAEFDEETFDLLVQEGISFALEVIAPTRTESDRIGCIIENGRVKVPNCLHEPYQKAYELGWSSIRAPKDFGGMGAPSILALIVNEAMTGGNLCLTMCFGLTAGAANLISTFGSESLKQTYLKKMFNGSFTGTMCLSEPHAGSDVGAGKTSAVSIGDGRYKIKGSKCWISSGDNDFGENIVHALLARVVGDPEGSKGLSLFIVPHTRVNEDGSLGEWNDVSLVSIEDKMGIHASPTAVLNFGDNNDCHGWIIGEEQQGMSAMFQMMNDARLYTGLIGLSLGGAAYENAKSYSKERIQGKKISDLQNHIASSVPIVNHPAVRYNLFNMKAKVEAMRALLYYTAFQFDLEKMAKTDEGKIRAQNMIDLLTPMCKGWCTEVGLDVVQTGIQILGGVGYTKDFPMEQLFRDARIAPIYEGTTDIQALDLIGRKMIKKDGILFKQSMEQFSQLIEEHKNNPILNKIFKNFEEYCELLYEIFASTQDIIKNRGIEGVALYATPFLMFYSSVTAGWLLLQQAVIASKKFEEIKETEGADDNNLLDLFSVNEDALFYSNKIKTVRYFVECIIPQYQVLLTGSKKRNYDALEIIF